MECTYFAIILVLFSAFFFVARSHTIFFPIDFEIYLTICVVTAIFYTIFFIPSFATRSTEPRFHHDK